MTTVALEFGDEARAKLLKGMSLLAHVVATTLGPGGRTVIMEHEGAGPDVSRDGAGIARTFELGEPLENMGVEFLKQAAANTERIAGDGTSTTIVLAYALAKHCCMGMASGLEPVEIRRGVDDAIAIALAELASKSSRLGEPDRRSVVLVATNQDPVLTDLIIEALAKAPAPEAVAVTASPSGRDGLEATGALRLSAGAAAAFTSPGVCELHDARVLVFDGAIAAMGDVAQLVEAAAKDDKALLLVARGFDDETLRVLAANVTRGALKAAAVTVPASPDATLLLEDLAAVTGAEMLSSVQGAKLERLSIDQLGRAKKVVVGAHETAIFADPGHVRADVRAAQVRGLIGEAASSEERARLWRRLRLLSPTVTLSIGGETETEAAERLERAEDGLRALQSALAEGVVPGGGVTLLRLSLALDHLELQSRDHWFGMNAVKEALAAPFRHLVHNAGLGAPYWAERLLRLEPDGRGLDLRTGEIVDLVARGILDPTRNLRLALENARWIATTVALTQAAITPSRADGLDTPETTAWSPI